MVDSCAGEMDTYVTHLECSLTGKSYTHDCMHYLSDAGAPLLVRYDLDRMRRQVDQGAIGQRCRNVWMWREFLPIASGTQHVTLGEAVTPLVPIDLKENQGRGTVLIKDEGRLPTGSFKARGMAIAVTMARYFGKTELVVPTAGNAGAAAAAYGAVAGMKVHVIAPNDTPDITLREIAFLGAQTHQVDGLIDLCGRVARAVASEQGWHNLATLAEPYRLEGKKTIGLELALQFDWSLPDIIYYPTGGGTGFIGMWKAFNELLELGWVKGKLPRMVSVQTQGCNPIKTAFDAGHEDVHEAFGPISTLVPGVRVPKPLGGRLILAVLRDSNGHASAVSDDAVLRCQSEAAQLQGIHLCLEGAACLAAFKDDLVSGRVSGNERAIIFNTATGYKCPLPEVPHET
ncbi:MAG: threonine synthase [Hyphomicrobiaceae bacterium]